MSSGCSFSYVTHSRQASIIARYLHLYLARGVNSHCAMSSLVTFYPYSANISYTGFYITSSVLKETRIDQSIVCWNKVIEKD